MRIAANADVVSCYLWDTTRRLFVLRGAAGWKMPDWIGAAFYEEQEGMTGTLASCVGSCQTAKYIPNLHVWKLQFVDTLAAKYREQMFGSDAPEGTTFEVIALPLSLKDEPLGIVTMHRRKPMENVPSGFATTDTKTLADAASNLSAFVGALAHYDFTVWEKEEQQRLSAISDTLLRHQNEPNTSMLQAVLQQIINQYQIHNAVIYLENPELPGTLRLATSPGFREGHKRSVEDSITDPKDPILTAFNTGELDERPSRVMLDATRDNRKAAKAYKAVVRVLVPLIASTERDKVLGVLDLRWYGTPTLRSETLPHHSGKHFSELGRRIASSIHVHTLRDEYADEQAKVAEAVAKVAEEQVKVAKEQTKVAEEQEKVARGIRSLAGMQTYLAYGFHDFSNAVQHLSGHLDGLGIRKGDPKTEGIYEQIVKLTSYVNSAIDPAKVLASTDHTEFQLRELLERIIEHYSKKYTGCNIAFQFDAECDHRMMYGVEERVRKCFELLLENACKYAGTRGSIIVTLSTSVSAGEWEVNIRDSGPGLPPDALKAIEEIRPILRSERVGGRGIFMAILFCNSSGGKFCVKSTGTHGTHLNVTLPWKGTTQ